MSSNTMCTSIGKREELDVHLHVVREKRRIEQMVLGELSGKENIPSSFSSGEMASFVREKVAERFPSGINFNGRTVYVNDEVHVKDDAVLLNSSERLLPARDSLKRIYLGERGALVQVVPSFYGRPAATLRFADGAQKTFYLECLDLVNVRKSLSDTEKQPTSKRTVISLTLPVKCHANENGGKEKQNQKRMEDVDESKESREERVLNTEELESSSNLLRKDCTSGKDGQFDSNSLQFSLSRPPSENLNDFLGNNSNGHHIQKRAIGQTFSETVSKVNSTKDKCESEMDEIGEGSMCGEQENKIEMKRNRLQIESNGINLASSGRKESSLVLVDKKPSVSPFIIPPPPLFSSLTASSGPPPPPLSLKELRESFLSPPPRSSSEVGSGGNICGYPSACISNPATEKEVLHLSEESAFTAASSAPTSPPCASSLEKNELPLRFPQCLEVSSRPSVEKLAEDPVTSLPAFSSCSKHSYDVLEPLTAAVHSPLLASSSRSCSSLTILSDVHAEISLVPSPTDPIRIVNARIPEEKTSLSLTVSEDGENVTETDVIGAPCSSLTEEDSGDALMRDVLTADESADEHVRDVGNSGALEMEDPCWRSLRSLGSGVPNLSRAPFGTVSSTKEMSSKKKNDLKLLSSSGGGDISNNMNTVEINDSDRGGEKQQHSGSYSSNIISSPLTLQVIESNAPLPDEVLKTLDREVDTNSSDTHPKSYSNYVFLSNGRSDPVASSPSSGVTSDPLFHDRAKKTMEKRKIQEPERRGTSTTTTGTTANVLHRGALGLVKHHLPPPPANVLHEKKPMLENLGTPYTMEQLDIIGEAELLSSQSFLGEMDEDNKEEAELAPLLEENVKLTGVPQSAPPGYKAKFSFYDANTSIPRYVPVKPSTLRRIMVAGSPLLQPTAMNSQEITCSPQQQFFSVPRLRFVEVFYRRDASMESILSAVTKALGWQKEGEKNAERLFTLAGNEVLWEENIVETMYLIATQGNLYHPQRSSTEVLTARAVEMGCPSPLSLYTDQSLPQVGAGRIGEKNEKNRCKDDAVVVDVTHAPLVQKSSSTLGSIVEESTHEAILSLKFSDEATKSGQSFPSGVTRWNLDHSENIISVSPLSNASLIPQRRGGDNGGADPSGALPVSASPQEAETSERDKIQRKGTKTSECKENDSQNANTVWNAHTSLSSTPNISPSVIPRNIFVERCKEEDSCLSSGIAIASASQVFDPTQIPLTGKEKKSFTDAHTTLSGVTSGSALSGSADTFQHSNDYVDSGGGGVDRTLISDQRTLTREAEAEAPKQGKRSDQNEISTSSATQSTKPRAKKATISFSNGKPFHVKVFENGLYDDDEGVFKVVTVRPNYKTIGSLKTLITRELGWRGGRKVDLLYDATGVPITDLAQLCDGDALVASAGDRFIVPYPNSILHREVTRKQLFRQSEC